ncbi:MAG: hypothetical protein MUF85_02480 [Patescibacteria group bacterium]|jgi:hypothetical protein|nr:hypothetical protein [Patescibacteria group bacterium]
MDPNAQKPQQPVNFAQSNNITSAISTATALPPSPHKTPVALIIFAVAMLLVSVTLAVLLVIFYGQAQDYKNNSDKKSEIAVKTALENQDKTLKEQFAQAEKEPLKEYVTPSSAASVKIVYPKTWSVYAVEGRDGNTVNNYFHPNLVNDTNNNNNLYALRLEVLDRVYTTVIKEYESSAKNGKVKISPFVAKNVKGAETGIRIDGEINNNVQGSMVVLPVRDKTIRIWTESGNYTDDFNKFILENLTYNP